ncbi:MAG: hypothetical protein COB35_01440 [Gammaproteobacteria bacterium]|nr:MAG: hypothetical protein COB35_01440 [Gammaproteobacteria bacterium]
MKLVKIFFIPLLLILSACSDDEKTIDINKNPEEISIAFFSALYNDKDLNKAAAVCVPKLSRIILHYRSAKAVGRHLFNLSYDKVKIRTEDTGVKVRQMFKSKAIITIYFDGQYNDNRVMDVKRLSLIQFDGRWYIDKILKDPF